MLRQDPSLDLAIEPPAPERSILVALRLEHNLDALVALGELLARMRPVRELILARLTGVEEMGAAAALLNSQREALTGRGVAARSTGSRPSIPVMILCGSRRSRTLIYC